MGDKHTKNRFSVKTNYKQTYDIASLKADGAYDTHRLYFEASRNHISAIIPPRETAKTLEEVYANPPPEESQRDKTIKSALL